MICLPIHSIGHNEFLKILNSNTVMMFPVIHILEEKFVIRNASTDGVRDTYEYFNVMEHITDTNSSCIGDVGMCMKC